MEKLQKNWESPGIHCAGGKPIDRLVLTHKDRLLRFVEVVIINKTESANFEDDLVQDVLEIITVFSARLYGARSRKNQKLLEALKEAAATI